MLLICSGFVCYGPQGGWHRDAPVYRTGGCFLCGLHSSVVRFPRPLAAGTTRRSDSRIVHRLCLFFGLRSLPHLRGENMGPPNFLTPLLFHATLLAPDRPSAASPSRLICVG